MHAKSMRTRRQVVCHRLAIFQNGDLFPIDGDEDLPDSGVIGRLPAHRDRGYLLGVRCRLRQRRPCRSSGRTCAGDTSAKSHDHRNDPKLARGLVRDICAPQPGRSTLEPVAEEAAGQANLDRELLTRCDAIRMALKHSRIPLGRADLLANLAIREAHQAGLPADDIIPVGGLRRFAPALDGAVLVAVADGARRHDLLAGFSQLSFVRSILGSSASSLQLATDRGLLEVHVASPDMLGAALVWHTGTRRHTKWLQLRATTFGLTFANGHLERPGSTRPPVPDEPAFYRLLDLPYIPPELREGEDEIAAAERGGMPSLITTLHIRGDLHMHSSWSDGRDSIMHMVLSSRQLGYEYVAITDHSERSWASRKLLALEIPLQREEIETVRSHASGIEILHGVEVDIMPDGSLDFDDDTLARFDIVLASLHDAHGQEGARLTERYLQAMRHPLVNVITHPANRFAGDLQWLRSRFRSPVRGRRRHGHGHGNRRRTRSPRYGWTDRPAGGGRRGDHRHQQRLSSSGGARTADELRYRHGSPGLDWPRAGAQYPGDRGRAGVHRPKTRTLALADHRERPSRRPTDPVQAPALLYRRDAGGSAVGASSAFMRLSLPRLSCYCRCRFWALPKRDRALTALAKALQARYQTVRDFTADFVQTYRGGVLRTETRERGTVAVKKPGRMRWIYTEPGAKRVRVGRPEDVFVHPRGSSGHGFQCAQREARRRRRCSSWPERATWSRTSRPQRRRAQWRDLSP